MKDVLSYGGLLREKQKMKASDMDASIRINPATGFWLGVACVLGVGCSNSPPKEETCTDGSSTREPVRQFSISSDSKLLATIGIHPSIKIQDPASRKVLNSLEIDQRHPLTIQFHPTRNALLATYGDCRSVVLWEAVDTERPRPFEIDVQSYVTAAAFSPDGMRIAITHGRKSFQIWDLATRRCVRRFDTTGDILLVKFAPDGRFVLLGGRHSGLRLWDLKTGRCRAFPQSGKSQIRHAVFSTCGRRIASSGFDGLLQEWSVETGLPQWSMQWKHECQTALCYAPDDRSIVFGTLDGDIVHCPKIAERRPTIIPVGSRSISHLEVASDGRLHVSSFGGTLTSIRLPELPVVTKR